MHQIYKRTFTRNDNKELLLYGYQEHTETPSQEINVNDIPKPHMRWNPSREEWVTYSAGRKERTFFPPKEYCPLCPGGNLNYPTEIPFKNFEVAVFPNRWASFNSMGENVHLENILSKPSIGECEVVVYSPEHLDTISEMPLSRIELLTKVWIDRYKELQKNPEVKYVLPFENRGEECGVTLHHPHGQIYAYPFIPPAIEKEVKAFKKENFLINIMNQLEENGFDQWFEETIDMNVVGYRRIFHVMPDEFSQNTVLRNNVKKIGSAGKPFDICFLPTQLKIAKEFAKDCDQMDLVLNHCGVPPIASGEIDEWGKDIKSLSELPNVTCKLSGLMAYCAPGTSSYETIKPYVDHSLECFGPDRMVWGSDYPVVNAGKGIQEWIKVTHTILGNLSDDEAKKIASSNAERIYKI